MYRLRKLLYLNGKRCISSLPVNSPWTFEHLKQRALIKVAGAESSQFLQGLITNDMNHLEHGMGCMYAMFLNNKGRVIYDTIVYKMLQNDTFYIECDVNGIDVLCRHLKLYRVRRKISVDNVSDEYNVHSLFNIDNIKNIKKDRNEESVPKNLEGMIVPCDKLKAAAESSSSSIKTYRDLLVYQDPRVTALGSRIISPKTVNANEQISEILNITSSPETEMYEWYRYNLGVGEGIKDLPPNNCFPLEANCDYLHGISFHKGCYIGQELTARTHHTGVVRKRLMPLFFTNIPSKTPEESIIHENVNLGKLRGISRDVGLGLLRISKALELKSFSVGNGTAQTLKPTWWPLEAPKERLNLAKS